MGRSDGIPLDKLSGPPQAEIRLEARSLAEVRAMLWPSVATGWGVRPRHICPGYAGRAVRRPGGSDPDRRLGWSRDGRDPKPCDGVQRVPGHPHRVAGAAAAHPVKHRRACSTLLYGGHRRSDRGGARGGAAAGGTGPQRAAGLRAGGMVKSRAGRLGGTRRRQKSPWEPAGRKTKLNKGLTLQVAAGAGRGRFGTFLSRSRTCFSSK